MKTLPVGISEGKGRNKGYRLQRTVRNKDYNFGSFQNYEHALRTNGYIDIMVADLKEAQEKEGIMSVDEIREIIVENSLFNAGDIASLFKVLDDNSEYRIGLLNKEIVRLHERLDSDSDTKKTFWERLKGR